MRQRSDSKPHLDSSVWTVLWSWSAAPASLNLLSNAWPSLTGNQGSVPGRVHINPLPLKKRSLKGQDLWTGVTGIIFNHEGQSNLWLKFSCQKSILLLVNRVSLEHSYFFICSVPMPQEGWSEGLGETHCKTKPLGMSWEEFRKRPCSNL